MKLLGMVGRDEIYVEINHSLHYLGFVYGPYVDFESKIVGFGNPFGMLFDYFP